jgi:hypothetical protein
MTEKKKPTKQKTPPEVVFPEGMANAKKPKKNNLLIDWEFVDRRLSEGCSGTEIAASIGVCFRTLSRRCRKDRGIAFEELGQAMRAKGVAFAKSVFYRKAFVEKDTASAIFWMKNNAGWTDRRQVEQNVNVTQSSFEDLVGGVENGQTPEEEE